MKNFFFIFSLAFILLGFYLYLKFDFDKDKNFTDANASLSCDLNIKDCVFDFKSKKINIFLNPKPLQAMQELGLKVENLDFYENLSLKIYGLNMFMGEIKPRLIYKNSHYEAKILLSVCTLDTMRYRAEFFKDDKPLGFHFDFELRR